MNTNKELTKLEIMEKLKLSDNYNEKQLVFHS
jgi:hypothetical protein